jgi:N-acetylmuramoyl-L-alanine amidase
MDWRQSPREDVARGALILLAAIAIAFLIVVVRVGSSRLTAPPPTPTPAPTATPLSTPTPAPTATLAPPTPTPVSHPAPPTPTPAPVPVAGADEFYARDGRNIVCLDPGHGGADLGNVRIENGKIALQEKDFTLQTAQKLADQLRQQGFEVVLTRDSDTEVNPSNEDVNGDGVVADPNGPAHSDQLDDLQARVNICNLAGADLLISIHYNGAENVHLKGYEVWYSNHRPFAGRSETFANLIHDALGEVYAKAGYNAVDRGIGLEDHAVTGPERPGKLVPSAMPGVVVESLFLTNDDDAAFLQSPGALDTIVGAYEEAIVHYFDVYPG